MGDLSVCSHYAKKSLTGRKHGRKGKPYAGGKRRKFALHWWNKHDA
ncbi:hypothetical protein [Janthinobacterium sp. PC23-8]|nr:hypothetical protein [Janthinobacterium sp. PC23-8]